MSDPTHPAQLAADIRTAMERQPITPADLRAVAIELSRYS
jgi:hypothetical protein